MSAPDGAGAVCPDDDWRVGAVMRCLYYAMDGNDPAVGEELERLSADGEATMFGACCSFAEALLRVNNLEGVEFLGFSVVRDGQVLEPEEVPATHQHWVWAHRFIALYHNGDHGALNDFYDAGPDGEEHVRNVLALLQVAVQALRVAEVRRAAEGN